MGERRDPYAAAYRFWEVWADTSRPHELRWLWVPAFAETTPKIISHPLHRHRNFRAVPDGLVDHAIAFGEFQQQVELVLRCVRSDLEAQADLLEADRGFLVDAERAAKIEVAFGNDSAGLQGNFDGCGDRFQRDAGAGDQRFQQHVAGAELAARAAAGGGEARY